MVVSAIQSQISTADLTLKPGYSAATLDVEVVNTSDRHASFYIVLAATGNEDPQPRRWYELSPMTSSKVPPGTHSCYTISIIDTPLPGFIGLANVTVRIISPELQSEERHVLRLRIEPGIGVVPFKIDLPIPNFQEYPGHIVEIPARIHNNNRNPLAVFISCPGIENWILEKSPTTLRLLPNRWHDFVILCQIPEDISLSRSQEYPFQILVVEEDGDSATAAGVLEVLPLGYFELLIENTTLTLPPSPRWFPDRHTHSTQAPFQLENHSNLKNTLQVAALPSPVSAEVASQYDCQVSVEPVVIPLEPSQSRTGTATIQVDRPWLGWVKILWIDLQARLEDDRLDLRHDSEKLQVRVLPVIPRWLQILGILLFIGAIAGLAFLQTYRQHHHQLVSTVQFNGIGSRVLSGSSDQTIRQWQVRRWGLRPARDVIRFDKAVRTAHYRPVDNNQLILGLENGEIQLWDLLRPDHPLRTFVNQTAQQNNLDDRVMALATTTDARYLFSGYGSGQVAQWYIGPDSDARGLDQQRPTNEIFVPELAIYDVSLVGPDDQALAIAGRYNKLLLWNWSLQEAQPSLEPPKEELEDAIATSLTPIDYPSGGQDDYITSLATAEQKPFHLATADNQGRITLWNLEDCLNQIGPCTVIDQWQLTPETAIRDIALSANGCYLVSASDDGRITLWPLTLQGRRLTKFLTGQTIENTNTRFNSVDIKILESSIRIVSGADDQRVRLHRLKSPVRSCQS